MALPFINQQSEPKTVKKDKIEKTDKVEKKDKVEKTDKVEKKDKIEKKEKDGKKGWRFLLAAVEILVLAVMACFLLMVYSPKKGGEPNIVDLPTESLSIAPQVAEDPVQKGYQNIALFGVDAKNESELQKGARSDSIMIASINLDTKEIKLVSLYRDSYMNIGDDDYTKICHAYHYGGAPQALQALNANLDMDIKGFITVGYQALSKTIDGLGGVYIDVDEEELKHINNYQIGVAEVLDTDYVEVKNPGYQLLNGLQASAYCRIRQTAGSDFMRTARQREVIIAMEEQAKKADPTVLANIFGNIMGDICTSFTQSDVLDMLPSILEYTIVAEDGFPRDNMRTNINMGGVGSTEVPTTLEDNVIWLHQFLFPEQDYQPSDRVKEYSLVTEQKAAEYRTE
jgi:LCP family protein required for cell wall assembly